MKALHFIDSEWHGYFGQRGSDIVVHVVHVVHSVKQMKIGPCCGSWTSSQHFRSFKPIFHWKWGSGWLPNANEICTKKWNVHGQRKKFAFGTQRHLYSTDWRWELASGVTQILALGNAKIYQHVGISNAKVWRQGHCPTPTPDASRSGI